MAASPDLEILVRRASPEDCAALTALAMRAKAHWGYDVAFMEACREELTVHPAAVATDEVWVAESGSMLLGFVRMRPEGEVGEIYACFVLPCALGSGVGRRLWSVMTERARALGCTQIGVDSDPNAVGFYERMGLKVTGSAPSGSIPGRCLPRLAGPLTGTLTPSC